MEKQHEYSVQIAWTGNKGTGTSNYSAYERHYEISIVGKQVILGSSDPAFRGDKTKYNPEELLVASLSSCHMLWYLHLCSEHGIVVEQYNEDATGLMQETLDGSGYFKEVTLKPVVRVSRPDMVEKAIELHTKANEMCYIAKSCKFPVYHQPSVSINIIKPATDILSEIEVVDYKEQYKEAFKRLNLLWLNKYCFKLEEDDFEVLDWPERRVLALGGHILFLEHHDRIIGTAALKYVDAESFELNKMTVDEDYRGIGAGLLLCNSAIEKARQSGAKLLTLYSVTSLHAAIAMYQKLGFEEVPLDKGKYKRANIKMSLDLKS